MNFEAETKQESQAKNFRNSGRNRKLGKVLRKPMLANHYKLHHVECQDSVEQMQIFKRNCFSTCQALSVLQGALETGDC